MSKINAWDVIRTAGTLLSEGGENYEYDRAIVEMVHGLLDVDADADKDTTARLLRGAVDRDTSIGLVEPAAEPGLYLPEDSALMADKVRSAVVRWRSGVDRAEVSMRVISSLLNDYDANGEGQ